MSLLECRSLFRHKVACGWNSRMHTIVPFRLRIIYETKNVPASEGNPRGKKRGCFGNSKHCSGLNVCRSNKVLVGLLFTTKVYSHSNRISCFCRRLSSSVGSTSSSGFFTVTRNWVCGVVLAHRRWCTLILTGKDSGSPLTMAESERRGEADGPDTIIRSTEFWQDMAKEWRLVPNKTSSLIDTVQKRWIPSFLSFSSQNLFSRSTCPSKYFFAASTAPPLTHNKDELSGQKWLLVVSLLLVSKQCRGA